MKVITLKNKVVIESENKINLVWFPSWMQKYAMAKFKQINCINSWRFK